MRDLIGRAWDALPFKRALMEPVRRTGLVPERIYRHLHFEGVFRTEVMGAPLVLRSHGHQLENEIFWSGVLGRWEGESLRVWASLARRAAVILDVGANSGIFALVARAVNPGATVVAFEPVDELFARLEENARLNGGGVRCVQAAVSDRAGTRTLYIPPGRGPYSSTMNPEIFGAEVGADWRFADTTCIRLDGFLAGEGLVPDLIKADVEGHEPEVLRGLGEMLDRHRPTLLLEVLDRRQATELWDLLGGLGYGVLEIDERFGLRPLEAGAPPTAGRNLLYTAGVVPRE